MSKSAAAWCREHQVHYVLFLRNEFLRLKERPEGC